MVKQWFSNLRAYGVSVDYLSSEEESYYDDDESENSSEWNQHKKDAKQKGKQHINKDDTGAKSETLDESRKIVGLQTTNQVNMMD
jgi:FtsZ-interacting cell division protein YlmF